MKNGILRKNTYRLVMILLLLVAGALILSLTNICESFHDSVKKLFEENHRVITTLMWIFGIGAAVNCYSDYLNRKQHEAVFGFYVNLRVYLERLDVFLGVDFDHAIVLSRMYTDGAKDKHITDNPPEEVLFSFVTLSKDLLNFLSVSKDNIPPTKGKNNFINWYEYQIKLVKFLQKGASLSNSSRGQYSDKGSLKDDYDDVKGCMKNMLDMINNRINADANET